MKDAVKLTDLSAHCKPQHACFCFCPSAKPCLWPVNLTAPKWWGTHNQAKEYVGP